jgi:hypothetical protein
MLRLGLSREDDWTGSAVDFVAAGLERFCQLNGLSKVSSVFRDSSIRLVDEIFDLSDYERSQSEYDDNSPRMFLKVHYDKAWEVSIGPTLTFLHSVDKSLPAAFFVVFADNLWRWMSVYDVRTAEEFASDQVLYMEDEELVESFFPKVKKVRPKFLKKLPSYRSAVRLLEAALLQCRDQKIRALLEPCLSMHQHGDGYKHAWPWLLENKVPEIEFYMENTDEPGPGVLIDFEENDLVAACFTEQVQFLGQEQSISSSLMMLIDLRQTPRGIDKQVKAAFDYVGAMLRSLSAASEVIERIGDIYDEHIRQRGIKPGLPAEQGSAAIRGE